MPRSLRVTVLLLLIACAAAASEWPVATPRLDVSPAWKQWPAIASDGADYLVIWFSDSTIVGTRVAADGHALDPAPFVIASGGMSRAAVAWNGTAYVVTWIDAANLVIRAARVSREGAVIDQRQIATYTWPGASGSSDVTAIASNGSRTVIAYSLYHDVYAVIVDNDLNVVVENVQLRDASSMQPLGLITASTDGQTFLVLWAAAGGGTWSAEGAIIDPRGGSHLVRLGSQSGGVVVPVAAFDGHEWILPVIPYGPVSDALMVTLSPDGTLGSEVRLPRPDNVSSSYTPAIAIDAAGRIALFWPTSDGRVVEQQLAPDMSVVSTRAFAPAAYGFVVSGDSAIVVTVANSGSQWEVRAIPVLSDGSPGTAVSVARSASYQMNPAIDADPQGWAAAWLEGSYSNPSKLYVGRLSRMGDIMTGEGMLLSQNAWSLPAIAFNGSEHLVVWWDLVTHPDLLDTSRLLARRISQSGMIGSAIVIADDMPTNFARTPAAVASDGHDWMIAWAQATGIRAQRMRADGSLDGAVTLSLSNPSPPAGNDPYWQAAPAITFGGGMYWVAWLHRYAIPWPCQTLCPAGPTPGDVYVGRLTADGQPLDPVGGIPVAVNPDNQDSVAIAATTEGAVVVWSSAAVMSRPTGIRAAAVAGTGQLLGVVPSDNGRLIAAPFMADSAPYDPATTISVATDGSTISTTWVESNGNTLEVHRAKLDAHANVIVPDRVVISGPAGIPVPSTLTRDSLRFANGRWYLGYARIGVESAYGGAPRAFIREIDAAPARARAVRR